MKAYVGTFVIYLMVFMLFGPIQANGISKSQDTMFQDEGIQLTVVDQDQSEISKGLIHYLKAEDQVTILHKANKKALENLNEPEEEAISKELFVCIYGPENENKEKLFNHFCNRLDERRLSTSPDMPKLGYLKGQLEMIDQAVAGHSDKIPFTSEGKQGKLKLDADYESAQEAHVRGLSDVVTSARQGLWSSNISRHNLLQTILPEDFANFAEHCLVSDGTFKATQPNREQKNSAEREAVVDMNDFVGGKKKLPTAQELQNDTEHYNFEPTKAAEKRRGIAKRNAAQDQRFTKVKEIQ